MTHRAPRKSANGHPKVQSNQKVMAAISRARVKIFISKKKKCVGVCVCVCDDNLPILIGQMAPFVTPCEAFACRNVFISLSPGRLILPRKTLSRRPSSI